MNSTRPEHRFISGSPATGLAVAILLVLVTACASSGPLMPFEPVRCFDSDGHEIPCVDEMDCHEDNVKEQA
jgi:hypothetical protein